MRISANQSCYISGSKRDLTEYLRKNFNPFLNASDPAEVCEVRLVAGKAGNLYTVRMGLM
jgi:hypothetical protein